MNVAVTIIAVKYMDKAGRKSLLTTSWIGLFFSYYPYNELYIEAICRFYGQGERVHTSVQTHANNYYSQYSCSLSK